MDAPFRMYDEYDVYMDESVRVALPAGSLEQFVTGSKRMCTSARASPLVVVAAPHSLSVGILCLTCRACFRACLQMRKLSTDLLTEAAKQRPNVQFIFITPHDIL